MVRKLEISVMEITPHIIAMESETVLTQYIITNWTLDYKNASMVSDGIQMTLVLKRRILNAILTVYLPTILVLIIVYATNFFKDFFFEVNKKFKSKRIGSTFSGNCNRQPYVLAGSDHPVHKRLRQPPTDGLREDGGRLADLRPGGSMD